MFKDAFADDFSVLQNLWMSIVRMVHCSIHLNGMRKPVHFHAATDWRSSALPSFTFYRCLDRMTFPRCHFVSSSFRIVSMRAVTQTRKEKKKIVRKKFKTNASFLLMVVNSFRRSFTKEMTELIRSANDALFFIFTRQSRRLNEHQQWMRQNAFWSHEKFYFFNGGNGHFECC